MIEHTYQTILVGIDGSDQANAAFEKALDVAKRNQGKLIVTHVIEGQMYNTLMGFSSLNNELIDQEKADAQSLLDSCKRTAKEAGVEKIETILTYGVAKEVIAKELPQKYAIDLIMVGQSGLNAVERMMIGSVSSYIIRHAHCDVLIVRPEIE